MAGEDAQDKGRQGLDDARRWLDLSTRVSETWAYDEHPMAELVHFDWPYTFGQERTFSFDLGGKFRGDHLHNQSFLAEIKNYKNESDLPTHFRNFLAKCYVALDSKPRRCDNFLWISWSPFQARSWDKHATTDNVRQAVLSEANRKRVLGVDNEAEAAAKLDIELTAKVANRVWLITLSDRQITLVPTEEHYYKMSEMLSRERGVGS